MSKLRIIAEYNRLGKLIYEVQHKLQHYVESKGYNMIPLSDELSLAYEMDNVYWKMYMKLSELLKLRDSLKL
jgi:hypothetical protein